MTYLLDKELIMNDYNGLSRAVREELEQRNEAEMIERLSKKLPTTESDDDSFWQRLRDSITLLTNKASK
jgi:hypothetical protein